ncbi:hypothetical protein SISNIDRAFT_491832 [Sistotremastrum niveocremeum HHB9708]|uniref:Uncharacterized protein n=1 Tax=Sistotremastrum niveocremeum HHB9708 TaxID=1314777 RepID=A0A164MCG8_9AGAM|nr:hypothetical protein SISNIDRAFT_491832 [Sistotremastrum niveocremeum HHB9708]
MQIASQSPLVNPAHSSNLHHTSSHVVIGAITPHHFLFDNSRRIWQQTTSQQTDTKVKNGHARRIRSPLDETTMPYRSMIISLPNYQRHSSLTININVLVIENHRYHCILRHISTSISYSQQQIPYTDHRASIADHRLCFSLPLLTLVLFDARPLHNNRRHSLSSSRDWLERFRTCGNSHSRDEIVAFLEGQIQWRTLNQHEKRVRVSEFGSRLQQFRAISTINPSHSPDALPIYHLIPIPFCVNMASRLARSFIQAQSSSSATTQSLHGFCCLLSPRSSLCSSI